MRNQGLSKTFIAEAAITKNRIVVFGADDRSVVQASAATQPAIGVSDDVGQPTIGKSVDVILDGVVTVEFGGSVTRGALLMADAQGRAITAAAAAGSNVRTIGVAMDSGVSGDLASVMLSPGSFQG